MYTYSMPALRIPALLKYYLENQTEIRLEGQTVNQQGLGKPIGNEDEKLAVGPASFSFSFFSPLWGAFRVCLDCFWSSLSLYFQPGPLPS